MFCEKCGHKIEPGELFCTNCGAKQPEQPVQPKPAEKPVEKTVEQPAQQRPAQPKPSQSPVQPRRQERRQYSADDFLGGPESRPNPSSNDRPNGYRPNNGGSSPSNDRIQNGGNHPYSRGPINPMPQMREPEPKKRSKVPFILGGVAALLIIAGGAAWALDLLPFGKADSKPEDTATAEQTDGTAENAENGAAAVDPATYTGYWMIDCYNSESTSFAGFELSGTADALSFSANQTWNQGEHTASIAKTTLALNEDKTQATGSYTDNNNSSGTVTLDFEDGELYITLTGSGTWSMTVQKEHCTRDPYGAQRQYTASAAQPSAGMSGATGINGGSSSTTTVQQPSSSGYVFYVNGQTASQDINDISAASIGSDRLWPTDTLTISDSDLSKLTRMEVAAVRNEIYARHGYSFSSADWRSYFSTATWYTASSSYSDSMLTSTEQLNRDTIVKFEKAKGWK